VIGLAGLLVSGFLVIDYAQLIHIDPEDCGPTVVIRLTDGNLQAVKAYHLVQPTLSCQGKLRIVCMQRAGTLTVFRASEYPHTSTCNEQMADPECSSIGLACVQKVRTLNVLEQMSDVLKDIVSFPVISRYHSLSHQL